MTGNGYVKLHRELLDSKLWSCSDATLRVALYLLLTANHKPTWHKRVEVLPGQTARSLTQISEDCRLSRKAVRYALEILQKDGFITIDEPFGAQQGHRITICKYDTWQATTDDRGTVGAHQGNHQGNHQGTTNKNDKNKDKDSSPLYISPQGGSRFVPPTVQDLQEYAASQNWQDFDAAKFHDFFTAKGWITGKTKMKDWKAAARNANREGWCRTQVLAGLGLGLPRG